MCGCSAELSGVVSSGRRHLDQGVDVGAGPDPTGRGRQHGPAGRQGLPWPERSLRTWLPRVLAALSVGRAGERREHLLRLRPCKKLPPRRSSEEWKARLTLRVTHSCRTRSSIGALTCRCAGTQVQHLFNYTTDGDGMGACSSDWVVGLISDEVRPSTARTARPILG